MDYYITIVIYLFFKKGFVRMKCINMHARLIYLT